MIVKQFQFNHFGQNTYVIHDESTLQSAVIDPGCFFDIEKQELKSYILTNNLQLEAIIFTHCHLDHAFGAAFIKQEYPHISIYAHKEENFFIQDAIGQGLRFGISMEQPPPITHFISDGSIIEIGNSKLYAIHVPGHSKGSLCYYNAEEHFLIAGDVLFAGSIGRSDLPGGSHETLVQGIISKLLILPEHTVVYSGHGPATTIGKEKTSNPFLQ